MTRYPIGEEKKELISFFNSATTCMFFQFNERLFARSNTFDSICCVQVSIPSGYSRLTSLETLHACGASLNNFLVSLQTSLKSSECRYLSRAFSSSQ